MTVAPHEPFDEDDLALLAMVQQAEAVMDPMPPGMLDRLHFAISLELMQAELATLTDQPLVLARGDLVASREPTEADTITFTSSTVSLMVVVGRDQEQISIDAWVTGGGLEVDLVLGGGGGDDQRRREVSDATGRLSWAQVPSGSVRFLIHPRRLGDTAVITPSIEV